MWIKKLSSVYNWRLIGNVFGYCVICSVEKPGRCPPVDPDMAGICVYECELDRDCAGRQKCCRNACGGGVCTKPVQQGM